MKGFVIFVCCVLAAFAAFVGYMTSMPGASAKGAPGRLSSDEEDLKVALQRHVMGLARDIGSRHVSDMPRLGRSVEYIEGALRRSGLTLSRYNVDANGKGGAIVVAELPGTTLPGEIVLVGASYDSPRHSPGANCNASGTAALIEIGNHLAGATYDRTLRLCFFVLSETPHAGTDKQGAYQYAKMCAEKKEKIVAGIVLDGFGSWSDADGSQSSPFPFTFSYPGRGDFLAFVGDFHSRALVQHTLGAFRASSRVPSEGCTVPNVFPGYSGSNAAALARVGVPAVLVTDTGSLRSEVYGTESDTVDRLQFDGMARATGGMISVVTGMLRRGALAP